MTETPSFNAAAAQPPELYVSRTQPTLPGAYIQPLEDRSVLETGKVITAQSDPVLAHAWAWRNYDVDVVFSIGQMSFADGRRITYMIARDEAAFLDSLHAQSADSKGGFIHAVAPAGFELTPDRIGQKKWLSRQPAQVAAPPRYVSLQDVLAQGVQIYVLSDKAFIRDLAEGHRQHPAVIRDGLARGALTCLNTRYGFPVAEIPAPAAENAAPTITQ